MRLWKSHLNQDFASWFEKEGKNHDEWLEIEITGRAAVARALKASWWELDYGSSLFFWRWPADHQDVTRKGVIPMFLQPPPQNKNAQSKMKDEELKAKIKEKL